MAQFGCVTRLCSFESKQVVFILARIKQQPQVHLESNSGVTVGALATNNALGRTRLSNFYAQRIMNINQ